MQDNLNITSSGILPDSLISEMILQGNIISNEHKIEENQIQPASIDLRLGKYAYEVKASFLTGQKHSVTSKLELFDSEYDKKKINLENGACLEKGKIYLIKLQESLNLYANVCAFANPKSSTGRLDILTRLVADNSSVFDHLDEGYKGNLYIEVASKSFNINVKTGSRLNQLRFRKDDKITSANITKKEWISLLESQQITSKFNLDKINQSNCGVLPFSVDLQSSDESKVIGYSSKECDDVIDFEKRNYPAADFWKPIYASDNSSLILEPDTFYILMTQESLAVPPEFAAEMVPYDTRAGEFRVHYAGFFDPGFGYCLNSNKVAGSRGVLEIRSYEVPFLLEHGQIAGWLRYEKMLKNPKNLYGVDLKSNYQGQKLKLAKHFC